MTESRRWTDVVRWLATRKPIEWPTSVEVQPQKIPTERVMGHDLRVTFINHSTVLFQTEGLNFLTDPIWSKRCGPFGMVGPKRVCAPGVNLEDLPPIDYVLISHNHYDHLDLPTIKRLQRAHDPIFCIGEGNRRWLARRGVARVEEFGWWQDLRINPDVTITFVPAKHYTRRGVFDSNRTLWGGFVVTGEQGAVYFAGDTGFGPHFDEIRTFFGEIRLALLPIGAYSPRWFMGPFHTSPDDAVQAHQNLDASMSIGVHYGTFQLSDEAYDAPVTELKSALKRRRVSPDHFRVLEPGQGLDVPTRIGQ
ncbi:MAG: MBL fold metallo-hydrolase [Chlamydiales bacterium]|nr:MBL fold metallo-hydrolase [Chlamydiales bacterium]